MPTAFSSHSSSVVNSSSLQCLFGNTLHTHKQNWSSQEQNFEYLDLVLFLLIFSLLIHTHTYCIYYIYIHVCVCWLLSLTLCYPVDHSPPGSSVHGDSPGKNTGVGCRFLLQGIFSTQGSNLGLLHFRKILYHLSYLYLDIYIHIWLRYIRKHWSPTFSWTPCPWA